MQEEMGARSGSQRNANGEQAVMKVSHGPSDSRMDGMPSLADTDVVF